MMLHVVEEKSLGSDVLEKIFGFTDSVPIYSVIIFLSISFVFTLTLAMFAAFVAGLEKALSRSLVFGKANIASVTRSILIGGMGSGIFIGVIFAIVSPNHRIPILAPALHFHLRMHTRRPDSSSAPKRLARYVLPGTPAPLLPAPARTPRFGHATLSPNSGLDADTALR